MNELQEYYEQLMGEYLPSVSPFADLTDEQKRELAGLIGFTRYRVAKAGIVTAEQAKQGAERLQAFFRNISRP